MHKIYFLILSGRKENPNFYWLLQFESRALFQCDRFFLHCCNSPRVCLGYVFVGVNAFARKCIVDAGRVWQVRRIRMSYGFAGNTRLIGALRLLSLYARTQ